MGKRLRCFILYDGSSLDSFYLEDLLKTRDNFSNVSCCAIPFILLTGRGGEKVGINAYDTGADSYFVKGGDVDVLCLALSQKIELIVSPGTWDGNYGSATRSFPPGRRLRRMR
jgi:hypothetical protein